jgi:hypothetical protein
MSARVSKPVSGMLVTAAALAVALGAILQPDVLAQAPSAQQAQPPAGRGQQAAPVPAGGGRQGGGGRGGRGGPPPPPGRAAAPVDLTGNWVSVVTEDWRFRMVTPPKGDTASVPLNAAGTAAAQQWDPSQDGRCEAYGVAGIMRMPTRLKISWQDDLTLKIETDAGQQTRLLHFAPQPNAVMTAQGPRTLQGYSVAEWQRSGQAFDAFMERNTSAAAGQRWGSLKVVTTNMLPGWLRRNGVPYSQNASLTEYYTRISNPDAGDWFVVTTIVEDPQYLQAPFITSSNFKKEANDSKWSPMPCKAS